MTVFLHFLIAVVGALFVSRTLPRMRENLFFLGVVGGLGVIHGLVPFITTALGITPHNAASTKAAFYAFLAITAFGLGWRLTQKKHDDCAATTALLHSETRAKPLQYKLIFWTCGNRFLGVRRELLCR